MKNEKGYTLFEMMIVLLIISTVSFISLGSVKSVSEAQKRNHFFEQLYVDLYYAQTLAITHQKPITVIFDNKDKKYMVRQGIVTFVTRGFDKSYHVIPSTLALNEIVFLHNGNVRKSGTIIFEVNKQSYKLTLLLGRGRFYIEKI